MRKSMFAAAAAVALGWSGAAGAETSDIARCDPIAGAPEPRVAACTRLLNSARLSTADRSTFHTHRGIALRVLGRYADAERDYDAAIRLNPANAEAYHSRGTVYYMTGRFGLAIEAGNRAVALKPQYGIAYEQRGLAHYRLGETDRAIVDFDKTLSIVPRRPLALYARGLAWRRKGDAARGDADIRAAEAIRADIGRLAATLGLR